MTRSKSKIQEANATRRHDRADRKVSTQIRNRTEVLRQADPTLSLGDAQRKAIMDVALEGQARADAYAAKHANDPGYWG